ncbi:transcriptional regulator, RpiR family [Anaerovirgula multivorans]|uniref:Transcriptional regulator, RpiR family n=1 Tax=Anaerovirgula multivorans TaxID=312168 RepID=A0A239F9G7_9FIRM|nr:MurR/RpiR family transcriptional regulator [Anaerovirgula multivorans]SNS52953.1 transcriptional regulator, RpiR family [Anaerovirgula multivorans]
MINLLGLIQMYNTYDHNSIFHSVATCLIKNYRLLDTMTSTEIADLCNVSLSTLNRFYKKMAYPMTVSSLPSLVSQTKDNYMFDGNYIPFGINNNIECGMDYYIDILQERIASLHELIDKEQIKNLVEDINSCTKVVFLGCPIPHGVWRFQMDLTLQGIENSAFMDPNYQVQALDCLEKGTIVFYTQYCRLGDNIYKKGILKCKDKIKKVVILTNNKEHPLSSLADYLFYYEGNGTEQDNILINIYMNLIALTFRKK